MKPQNLDGLLTGMVIHIGVIGDNEMNFKPEQYVDFDTDLQELAHYIHGEICDCDDKYCTIETEILDWLKMGNPLGMTIRGVVTEATEFFYTE